MCIAYQGGSETSSKSPMTDEDSDIIRYITSSVETQLIRVSPTEFEIDDCKKKFTREKIVIIYLCHIQYQKFSEIHYIK